MKLMEWTTQMKSRRKTLKLRYEMKGEKINKSQNDKGNITYHIMFFCQKKEKKNVLVFSPTVCCCLEC